MRRLQFAAAARTRGAFEQVEGAEDGDGLVVVLEVAVGDEVDADLVRAERALANVDGVVPIDRAHMTGPVDSVCRDVVRVVAVAVRDRRRCGGIGGGCSATAKCNPTVDESACVSTCKSKVAASVPKARADYVAATTECRKNAPCDKLESCGDTAAAAISPTPTASAFCDSFIKKNVECKSGVDDVSICIRQYKVFADITLEDARTCLAKSCAESEACLRAIFG